ncbi:MAG: hemerythrin domain-containing protein [Gallionella sp.]|nr:hemerythrin domain-containing protein [Gallionella sp.]
MSVGNAVIDSDHKKLVELVNDIAYAAKARDRFALSRAIKLFKFCINCHFINEEQFAQALDFPFALHKLAHQNMRIELDFATHELKKNSASTMFIMGHYAKFLRDWLIKHITEEDMQMKPLLQIYPYDFKIDGALRP